MAYESVSVELYTFTAFEYNWISNSKPTINMEMHEIYTSQTKEITNILKIADSDKRCFGIN